MHGHPISGDLALQRDTRRSPLIFAIASQTGGITSQAFVHLGATTGLSLNCYKASAYKPLAWPS